MVLMVPIGLVSVMPQEWMTAMPRFSKARIMAGGAAAPPITTRLR